MSEFRKRRAEGSDATDPDSAFALLGFDGAAAAPPTAGTRVPTSAELLSTAPPPSGSPAVVRDRAAASGLPLTRRELRALEQEAELASQNVAVQNVAMQPAAMQPAAFPAPSAPALSPQNSLFSVPEVVVPGAQVSDSQGSSSARRGASAKGVKKSGGPRKPKLLRPVKPPRGVSRPSASTRSRGKPVSGSRPKSLKRRMLSKLMTLGAMVGAGLMMVSTSIPANAFYPVEAVTGTVAAQDVPVVTEVQSMKVQSAGDTTVVRDRYTAVSLRERLFLEYGNRDWSYSNNPNGKIQWPFAIAVPISSGFGARIAPCGGCSSYHEGVDFTPGGGTPIQVIADGVVSLVANDAWGLGSHVIIDHQINGQLVQSVYGHMQAGSIKVQVGQQVKVTDIVGLVGSTGASTGDHLHFEIHVNGVQVDPFAWLKKNAK